MRSTPFLLLAVGLCACGSSSNGSPDGSAYLTSSEAGAGDAGDPFTDPSSWTTFDTSVLGQYASKYSGVAFDGRYVYFAPGSRGIIPGSAIVPSGLFTRYDTTASFTAAPSWSVFDVATVNILAKGFAGAAFDGRYVYLVPYSDDVLSDDGIIARYDTTASLRCHFLGRLRPHDRQPGSQRLHGERVRRQVLVSRA